MQFGEALAQPRERRVGRELAALGCLVPARRATTLDDLREPAIALGATSQAHVAGQFGYRPPLMQEPFELGPKVLLL